MSLLFNEFILEVVMALSLISTVASTVAEAKGVDVKELDVALQDHVDVDAIDALASHESNSWTLLFELPNHEVIVRGEGTVSVDDVEKEIWA